MVWVDNPPNGLPVGYYPVDTGNTPRRASTPTENANKRATSRNTLVNAGPSNRITELNNMASVDLVSSAARKMTIGANVVRYVNAVEEAYTGERRRRADNDAGSSEAPTRTRIRLGDPVGTQPGPSRASTGAPGPAPAMSTDFPQATRAPQPQVLRDSNKKLEELP